MAKKTALTPNQRQSRFTEKLKLFGIKKIYFKASGSEQLLIERAQEASGCSSREEFLLEAVRLRSADLGLTLADMQKELNEKK